MVFVKPRRSTQNGMRGSISLTSSTGVMRLTFMGFSLTDTVVLFRLVKDRECKKASQGDFCGQSCPSTSRSDFDWTRHAAGLRAAGDSQRGAAGAAEPAEAVREAGAHGGAASGYLRAGCVLRGGGAGA